MCVLHEQSLDKITPRCLCSGTSVICWFCMNRGGVSGLFIVLEINIDSVLAGLKETRHFQLCLNQRVSLSVSWVWFHHCGLRLSVVYACIVFVCCVCSWLKCCILVRLSSADFEGFLYQILSITLFSYLNSWERASIFPFQCGVLNKGTTGTNFITYLVWLTRSLTGDWTRDLPHSKPALYH